MAKTGSIYEVNGTRFTNAIRSRMAARRGYAYKATYPKGLITIPKAVKKANDHQLGV